MRNPTFNKREVTYDAGGRMAVSICLFCKKNEVPMSRWNRRCDECRQKQAQKDENEKKQIDMGIGKRIPAAVITIDNTGQKVFVDKFGREIENPGYDLENDPRGWRHTKTIKESTFIK